MKAHIIQELKDLISGTVALPGESIYETASHMMVRTVAPGVVVQPDSSEDLAKLIRYIKKHSLPFAVRGGGHSNLPMRMRDGLLLIDMSGLATIELIDSKTHAVKVGGGALWREVATALEKYGLGISSGDTGGVGVGGLSTGAGLGWMVRKYGPVVDNTLELEVVTADGLIVTANTDHNADLFWAVRGGGSNFGIVTAFTFAAHPVSGVFHGTLRFPLENVRQVITDWRDAMRRAPAELTTMLTTLPPLRGNPALITVDACFEGTDKTAADRALAPFLQLGRLIDQNVAAKPYRQVLEDCDTMAPGRRIIGYSTFVKECDDELIAVIDKLCQHPNSAPIFQIRHVAGAMNLLPLDATAFPYRNSELLIVNPNMVSFEATKDEIENASKPWCSIEPFGQGPYLNLTSEDTGKEVAQAFPPATLERLRHIKTNYDPDNLFTTNFNIAPIK